MAQHDPIAAGWNRIEKWLGENAPETLEALAGGASAAAIAKFERTCGVKLPAAVAAWFRLGG
jgi:cell wall assembly regulator SMI1